MTELDPQTKSTVVQGIVSGAGRSNPEEFLLLRKLAAFLCAVGPIIAILGGVMLAIGLMGFLLSSGSFIVVWGFSLLPWGISIYIWGAFLKLLLAIEGHLRELRDRFQNPDQPTP